MNVDVEVPHAARNYLKQRVAALTLIDSAVSVDGQDVPFRLAPGRVHRVAEGGPFGWSLQVRLDLVAGCPVLECLEDSRMSGQVHYTLDEAGTRRSLPGQRTMLVFPAASTSQERESLQQEYFTYNRAVAATLIERGFA